MIYTDKIASAIDGLQHAAEDEGIAVVILVHSTHGGDSLDGHANVNAADALHSLERSRKRLLERVAAGQTDLFLDRRQDDGPTQGTPRAG